MVGVEYISERKLFFMWYTCVLDRSAFFSVYPQWGVCVVTTADFFHWQLLNNTWNSLLAGTNCVLRHTLERPNSPSIVRGDDVHRFVLSCEGRPMYIYVSQDGLVWTEIFSTLLCIDNCGVSHSCY